MLGLSRLDLPFDALTMTGIGFDGWRSANSSASEEEPLSCLYDTELAGRLEEKLFRKLNCKTYGAFVSGRLRRGRCPFAL